VFLRPWDLLLWSMPVLGVVAVMLSVAILFVFCKLQASIEILVDYTVLD